MDIRVNPENRELNIYMLCDVAILLIRISNLGTGVCQ